MKIKNVQLRDFNIGNVHKFNPNKNVNIKWFQDELSKQNNETYVSVIGNKADINNQLSNLSKNILSERVRTLNNIPKSHSFNGKVERIW